MASTIDVAHYAVMLASYAARNQAKIAYTEGGSRWDGIDHSRDFPELPHYADCSAFCTWVFWASRRHVRGSAGADIVNGQRWMAGYTGTMINHGARHRDNSPGTLWKPGRTCVFYADSGSTPTHVALYVGNGRVISHGSQSGPQSRPYNYRRIVQARAYAI